MDKIVAERLRRRRIRMGLSQKEVAQHIGVSYQQVQKYEKGVSRISAGALMKMSTLLEVSPSDFFSDHPAVPKMRPKESGTGRALSSMEQQLLDDFAAIDDPQIRTSIVHLVASIIANGTYRRHPRIVPDETRCEVWDPSMGCFEARIMNVSISGAAIRSEFVPKCGSEVRIGKTPARIVRIFDGGFAVEFHLPIKPDDLKKMAF